MLAPFLIASVALSAPQTEVAPTAAEGTTPQRTPGWYAQIDTERGRIVARLLPEQAPQSVAHFAALAEGRLEWSDPISGEPRRTRYYDGIEIHLAEAGQRFEAGDRPEGPIRYVPLEGLGPITFQAPGRLGMTRSGGGKISAVQFFATASGMPWLNGKHPCFAEVVEGLGVIRAITEVGTYSNGRPIDPVRIVSIQIVPVGTPPPLPEPRPYRPVTPRFEARPEKRPGRDSGPNGLPPTPPTH